MLCAEKEGRWDAQAWEFEYEHWEGTSGAGHEKNDEKPSDMQAQIVVGLRFAIFAGTSSRKTLECWI
jgi:hypothetical protein